VKLTLDPADIDAIASAIVEKLRAGDQPGWLDQSASSLGRRRHIAAVRRRIQAGDAGAVQIGRRYLLSVDAHAEEMGRVGTGASTDEDAIAAEMGLRLVGGARR
jgi:hypothetical protein